MEEQYQRAVRIDSPGKSRDKNNEAIVIGIAYGDGIGPIITSEAERLLKVILAGELERGEVKLKKIEGLTIENRMEKGEAVPKDVLEEIKTCDVFLKVLQRLLRVMALKVPMLPSEESWIFIQM